MAVRVQYLCSLALTLVLLLELVDPQPVSVTDEAVHLICPHEFVLLGGRCYYFSTESTTWPDADLKCSKRLSHLTTISTAEENKIVKDYVRNNEYVPGLEGWWIGGVRILDNGEDWVWTSTLYIIKYVDWCAGEPNDYGAERCLSLNPQCNYQWNDRSCDFWGFRYICETLPL